MSWISLLLAGGSAFAEGPSILYRENFQQYQKGVRPAGWLDVHVGELQATTRGEFNTDVDPLVTRAKRRSAQPARGEANIVFGTTAAGTTSGSRLGSFATYTPKIFFADQLQEIRGRVVRLGGDQRVGFTLLSGYPTSDRYYLIGQEPVPGQPGSFVLRASAFGTGTGLTGVTSSNFEIAEGKWTRFAFEVEELGSSTRIRARFWNDGTPEPQSWAIEASDDGAGRLKLGRFGVWAARPSQELGNAERGAFVDDLTFAEAEAGPPTGSAAPVITLRESGTVLPTTQLAMFNRDARVEVSVTDDEPGVASAAYLDAGEYVSGAAIAAEGRHTLTVIATDNDGNEARASLELLVDKTPPLVTPLIDGLPVPADAIFDKDVVLSARVTDISTTTLTGTLNGQGVALPLPIAEERAHDASIRVVDQLGWVSTVSARFIVDKTAPIIHILANGQELSPGTSFRGDVVVTFSGADPNLVEITGTLNGAPFTAGDTVSAEGVHSLVVTARDRGGNQRTDVRGFAIARIPPGVRVLANGSGLQGGAIFGAPVVFTLEIVDDSPTTVVATIDDQGYTPGSSFGTEGENHSIRVAVTNAFNNTTIVGPLNFTVDLTPPTIALTEGGEPFVDGRKFNRDATPVVNAVDNIGSPIVQLEVDGIPFPQNTPISSESTQHTIEVTATDTAGHNKTVGPLRFVIDKTKPVVRVTEAESDAPFPADGLYARPVRLKVRVTDLTTTSVLATLAGVPVDLGTPVVEADGTRTYTSAPIVADGLHAVVITATDEVGWVSDPQAASFTIDQTPPVLTITSPAGDATLTTGKVLVQGTSDDAVSVSIGGRSAIVDPIAKTFSLADVVLSEGSNDLVAEGLDRAGNRGTGRRTVHLDTRAPELTVTAPNANACLDVASVEVTGTVNDAALAQVRVSAGGAPIDATLTPDRRSFTASLRAAAEGKITVRVEAVDASGHTSTATIPVTIDRTNPVVEVTESGHTFNAALLNRSVSLFVRVKDTDPATALVATLNGQPYSSGTAIADERDHELRATATDCAGNTSDEVVVRFRVDRTPPSIDSITPANDATINTKPAITGVLHEHATLVDERTGRAAVVTGTNFTLDNILEEGVNTFSFLLTDDAGNQARVPHTVTVDTTAPTVEIVENGLPIATDALFARTVTPVIRSGDTASTITATSNGNPYTSGTAITADGSYTITAKARDALGNESPTATATFRIDRSAPAITITSPASGAVLATDAVEVRGTVTGSDIASVIVNGVPAALTDPTWIGSATLDFGPNAITAVVTDRAGNIASATVEVERSRGGIAIVLTAPPDHLLTNRPTTMIAGQVITPSAAQGLTINGQAQALDPAGVFRRNDFPLAEGDNVITATVTSLSGTPNSVRVTVTADFTPPALTVLANGTALDDGARFATSPAIALQAEPNATTTLTIDGELASAGVTTLIAGGHTLSATARDAAGNETRVDRIFFIGDAVIVSGCGLSNIEPATGNGVSDETIRITGRSGGALGVLVNGHAASVADGSFCGDATLAFGRNEVTIQCADSGGHPTSETPVVLVIHRYGDPDVTITSPTSGAFLTTNKVTVTGTVNAGVVSGDVNGIAFTVPDDGAATHTFSVPDVPVAPGLNVLIARAKTSSSRTGAASVRVRVVGGTPQLAITSPLAGTETGATTVDVSGIWTNIDPATLVVTVGASTYPATVKALNDTTGTFVATGVSLAPGVVTTVRAAARNAIGTQVAASADVRHDATAPAIAISTPLDVAYVASSHAGPLTVTGTISADAGSQVQVNGVSATLTSGSFSAEVDINAAASGITPVIARVITPDGDQATDSIRVVRLLTPLAVKSSFPAADANGVDPGIAVVVLFTSAVDKTSASALRVTDAAGAEVAGELFVDRDAITFGPAQPLRNGQRYTVTIAETLKDAAGAQMAAANTFSFTVAGTAPMNAPVVDDTPTTGCFSGTTITGRITTPGGRARLDVDGVTITTVASDTGAFRFTFTFSGQTGYHLVRVREVGTDGTLSAERALCFRINCSVPQVVSAALDRTAKTLTIRFNRAMDIASLVAAPAGSILIVPDDDPALTGTVTLNATNESATVALSLVPEKTIALTVKKSVKDTAGASMSADYTQSFPFNTDPTTEHGNGYITGAIYDATNGRPLGNTQVILSRSSSALVAGPSPVILSRRSTAKDLNRRNPSFVDMSAQNDDGQSLLTDNRGRYAVSLPEGAYTITATAPGYTTAWRQIVVPAGAGVVPIDIRLTRRGPEQITSGSALTLTHGGDTKVTKPVELALAAASLPNGRYVRLTSVGAQSLAGLLPLGWSPLAAAEITVDNAPALVAMPAAKLTFTIDAAAVTAATQTLSLVQYESEGDEWRVVVLVANVPANGKVTFDITASGNYALVYSDKTANLIAQTGAPLPSAPNPCAATPDVCRLTSRSFVLDPTAVLPNGRTVATLTTDGVKPYPSGTAVQAFIDEQLNLADGRVLVDPPFATDLLLYRTLAGDAGVADFHLSPSAQAVGVILRDGVDHIRIVDYPGRIDRGTLIGAEGGRVPGDDSVRIDIPAGATRDPLHASVASIPANDLAALGPIAGFRIAGGFTLELTRTAAPPQLPDGIELPEVDLLTPARATLSVAAAPTAAVVLAEILPSTPYGTMPHLIALTQTVTTVDIPGLRVVTTRHIVSTQLPLDGIVRPGRYLILVAEAPVAYAYGQVRTANGVATANARITAPPLGLRDLTRVDGLFVVPVPAAPAAPFTLIPRSFATGDGATFVAASAPAAETFVNVGALPLAAQPPKLISVTPADGTQIDAGAVVVVQATFDVAIDAASIADGIRLTNLTTNASVAGTVSLSGNAIVRFTPAQTLRPSSRYAITIAPTIRSTIGAPFASTATSQFTTRANNTIVRPERIRITLPDAAGKCTISGSPGAIPSGAIALAVRRGRSFIESYTATAVADGSFSFDAGHRHASDPISLDDTIDLEVLDAVSHAIIAVIELTQFSTPDGRGFYARPDRQTTFTSVDGIRVVVPAGAFDTNTLVTLAPAAKTAFTGVPNFDAELTYATSVEIKFDGVAKKALDLEMPVPANFDPSGKDWLLGYLGDSVRGPRVLIAHTMYVENGTFKTGLPQSTSGGRRVASNAAIFGEQLQQYLAKIRRSGIYATVNLSVPGAGLAAGFIQGLQGAFDLFWNTMESLYAPYFYLADNDGKIVIPVIPNRQFTLVGVDAGTGLQAFSKVYNPDAPSDPGAGVVLSSPMVDRIGPYPVFATPFRVAAADVEVEEEELTSVPGFKILLSKTGSISAETSLDVNIGVSLFNATRGAMDSSRVGGLSVPGSRGDRVVLLVEQREVDPDSTLSIVFSESLALPSTDEAIEDYLRSAISIETRSKPANDFLPITGALRLKADSGGRRVLIETPASLTRGNQYRIVINQGLTDLSGLAIGQVRDAVGNLTGGLTEPLYLQLTVRAPGGVRGSFDLPPGDPSSAVRDQALNGNLLFITALSGGIVVYDIADPAGMGSATAPIGRVSGSVTSYWGIASDHHGRVFATGLGSLFGVVQSFRLEDFLPTALEPGDVKPRGSATVSWIPGAAASLGIDSRVIAGDRPEAIPRKLQILLQDDETSYDNRAAFKSGTAATVSSTTEDFEVMEVELAISANFPYATQRITVENMTLDLRWSADATIVETAKITGIVARAGDRLRLIRNHTTYGVISLFGYGIGVFDLNAMDSNDAKNPMAGTTGVGLVPDFFGRIREGVRLTDGKPPFMCGALDEAAIPDLTFSPDAMILPDLNTPNFRVFALDASSGVLDLTIQSPVPDDPATTNVDESLGNNTRCDERGPLGLRFHRRYFTGDGQVAIYDDPRLAKLRILYRAKTGRDPIGRYTGSAHYRWTLEGNDNRVITPEFVPPSGSSASPTPALGARGSVPGQRVTRDYMLIPGHEYGLLVVEAGGDPGPSLDPAYSPLRPIHLVDVIWIPDGAYAVRTIPRTNLATVVDGSGHILIVDLSRIDERWDDRGLIPRDALFPTVAAILADNVATPDPRIVWKSEIPLATGTLAPVIDPDTGFLYIGKLLDKTTSVVAALDPRMQIKADVGAPNGLSEIGGVVPLGVDPPSGILLCAPTDPGCNASLAAFRFEITLPGAMTDSLTALGKKFFVAVESERVFNAVMEQTPASLPPSHLRQIRRDNLADSRADARFEFKRAVPAALAASLRHQRGFNKWISPWIVAIADPRASERYSWPSAQTPQEEESNRAREGCTSCRRPRNLRGKGAADGVFELYTTGRLIAARPERASFQGTGYEYLSDASRLTARFSTVMADTVRPPSALVAAQNPPVAGGMLQETTYLHSGELETSTVDLDAGGRAGWDAVFDRTYRSRTIGGSLLGPGWESSIARRLCELPNGNVEYRDGAGEVWFFHLDKTKGTFIRPRGLFLTLSRTDRGFLLVSQKKRITAFDRMGRLEHETDEFAPNPYAIDAGNIVRYLYDENGQLAKIIDPVGRSSTLRYYPDNPNDSKAGRLASITDWRSRVITYDYDAQGRLESAALPVVSGRTPTMRYGYEAGASSYNDILELQSNLLSVTDPIGGTPRVTFGYGTAADRDKVILQTWRTGETGGFKYGVPTETTDALGQVRKYTFTPYVPIQFADRVHIKHVDELDVETSTVPFGELPGSVSATSVPRATRMRSFELGHDDEGLMKTATLAGVRTTTFKWASLPNDRGSILESQTTGPDTTSPSARSASANANGSAITRHFGYEGSFLKCMNASEGSALAAPIACTPNQSLPLVHFAAVHADKKNDTATNDEITDSIEVDVFGRPKSMIGSGGTDATSEGSEVTLSYDDTGAKHALGLLTSINRAGLVSKIEYPSPNRIIETNAARIETTTDLDEWLRPKHTFTSVNGNPVSGLGLDESVTYDANERLFEVKRNQASEPVTERFYYDEMGRVKRTTTDRVAVGVALQTVETNVEYNLKTNPRTIKRTLPGGAVVTEELDSLGRVRTRTTSTGFGDIKEEMSYDLAGNLVYSANHHVASGAAFDVHGRLTGTLGQDGTKTAMQYDAMGRPKNVQRLDATGQVVSETNPSFTPAGQLKSVETKVDASRMRKTETKWDGAGRATRVATSDALAPLANLSRAREQRYEKSGLLKTSASGAGTLAGVTTKFDHFAATYNGALLDIASTGEKNSVPVNTRYSYDTLANPINQKTGSLEWTQTFDEDGNVKSAKAPARFESTFDYDARGNVTAEHQPGSARAIQHGYAASGASESYRDQKDEVTSTVTDRIGRPRSRTYEDNTSETFTYDGSRLQSMTDRQGRTFVYIYNDKGQLAELRAGGGEILESYGYDASGRLEAWTTRDAQLRFENFDLEGRPRRTRQIRYANGSGFSGGTILTEHMQEHEWSVHGERSAWTMPLPVGFTANGWTKRVEEDRDAVGNVTELRRMLTGATTPAIVMTADYRGAGRPNHRTVTTTSGAPIVRDYSYDATTGQIDDLTVTARGHEVAGSGITYDGVQIKTASLHGVSNGTRASEYTYDARSRLATSKAVQTSGTANLATEVVTDADFRTELERSSTGPDALPSLSFTHLPGHKIEDVVRGGTTRTFQYGGGAERIDDGRFVYEFDARGRLTKATEKPLGAASSVRRISYFYSAADRVIGRLAEYAPVPSPGVPPANNAWKPEDRNEVLGDDGLPADVTFVWDPISDTLVTVAATNGDPLRQIIQGGSGYDDPIEVAVAENGVAQRLHPVFDEAGTGTLQIILNENGEVVSRTVEEGAYGEDEFGLAGAAVDRIALEATKSDTGVLQSVRISIRTTEQLALATVANGGRLAVIDANANGAVVRSSTATPTLFDNYTLRWTLTGDEWTALTSTAGNATHLSIAVRNTLRASAWDGDQPILPAPDAASLFTSTALPVDWHEPLTDLVDWLTAPNPAEKKLFEAASLGALGGRTTPAARLILAAGFQALPFVEPVTGLVYVRARWYDPSTGSFLTPDPLGYTDSSNLYAFGAGDPVNRRDPTGNCSDPRACFWGIFGPVIDAVDYGTRAITGVAKSVRGQLTGIALSPITAPLKPHSDVYRVAKAAVTGGGAAAKKEAVEVLKTAPVINTFVQGDYASDAMQAGDTAGEYFYRTNTFFGAVTDQLLLAGAYQGWRSSQTVRVSRGSSSRSSLPADELDAGYGSTPPRMVEESLVGDVTVTPWGTRSNASGKFVGGARAGVDPVADFIAQAEANGFDVLGREVYVQTPFEVRHLDVVLRNRATGEVGGVEIKSSLSEFEKFKPEQFAADRYIKMYGAKAFGESARAAGVRRVDSAVKILWEPR